MLAVLTKLFNPMQHVAKRIVNILYLWRCRLLTHWRRNGHLWNRELCLSIPVNAHLVQAMSWGARVTWRWLASCQQVW